jgi:ubiquinone biosynthesis accessory factor UbiJ
MDALPRMSRMLQTLQALLAPAVTERLTLVLNHVIGGEPAAVERLRPHAGRTLALTLEGWPTLLPPPPPLAWRVTPAGLLEWCGPEFTATPDLTAAVDAANPALLLGRALAGERPSIRVQGDAAFAGQVHWLLENLRWDVAGDLQRLFGPAVAEALHRTGRALAGALKSALSLAAGVGERFGGLGGRPGTRP